MTNPAVATLPTKRPTPQAAMRWLHSLHWTPSFALAVAMLAIVLGLIFVTPLMPGYDVYSQDLGASMAPPFTAGDEGFYLLGTDPLGRDMLSRLSLAGQVSLFIGVTAVVVSMIVGVTLGLIAGFFGGYVESLIMGLADLQLSIPRVLLLIGVAALIGSSVFNLTMLLALTSWVTYGRIARALALTLKEREFVLAARVQGASPAWNIRKHLLPNVLQPMLIVGAFELGQIIVLEASLSYLGVGVRPPLPSWGMMINEGQNNLQLDPWLAILPGLAIFMLVAGIQFVSQHFSPDGERAVRMETRRG